MNTYYQQGDVLLKQITKLPEGLELQSNSDKILQWGETTGHKHRFEENEEVEVYIDTSTQKKYILVGNVAYLRHEEHKEIPVPPGIYEIDIVREWDYDSRETRRVLD